jgi:mannose-6-phosphate isomerase
MTTPPIPVVFEPIAVERPWGGRALERLYGKRLPASQAIGESWEIADLPGAETRVRDGPLAGCTLPSLIEAWGEGLTGSTPLASGRFPLLVKLLDARENLSVQVHPSSGAAKHEAWFVIEAAPGAEVLIGLKDGVSATDLRAAAGSAAIVPLLRRWAARPGRCYHIPGGTPHALGGGAVVVEVQTPVEVTHRLYDWDRRDAAGRTRELHIEQALAEVRRDASPADISQPRSHVGGVFATVSRLLVCESFMIDRVRLIEGAVQPFPHTEMVIWVVLAGAGELSRGAHNCRFKAGETVLIPADSAEVRVIASAACDLLEVKVPVPSTLAGYGRPERESLPRPGQPMPLTRPRTRS